MTSREGFLAVPRAISEPVRLTSIPPARSSVGFSGSSPAPPARSSVGSRFPARTHFLSLLLVLPLASCIEDRMTVEISTQIHGDGACTRRIEYRLERVDTGKGGARIAIPPAEDVLRQQRFPVGEAWQKREENEPGLHTVTLEGKLGSPQDVDGDYFRARSPQAQPARNLVSAYVDPERGYYEYQELLKDPASPIAAERLLSRSALKRDQAFADAFAQAFAEATQGKVAPPRSADLRQLFRQLIAEPYARDVAKLAERPLFGPREQRALERIHDQLDDSQKQLTARIAALTTGVSQDDVASSTEAATDKVTEGLVEQLREAGMPVPDPNGPQLKLSFRATLVMPAPIQRANTCFAGDTAVWEFAEEDLFGRGLEMTAIAATR